jgi:peroxiredoxin
MKWVLSLLILTSITCSGQSVQNFSLTSVSTGQYVALADFTSKSGVVIIFASTDCPYDNYYLKRVSELAAAYQSRVTVLFVNPNQDESMEQMKKYVQENNIEIPYLWDLEQKAMTALGAHKSPECFLLAPVGNKFNVVYKGAIDDNPQTAADVNKSYLKKAIDALLAKQKIETSEMRPVGCSLH